MATARHHNQTETRRDKESKSGHIHNRAQLQRALTEIGLNPSDYILSPLSKEDTLQGAASSHTSAFSSYPSQQPRENRSPLKPQTKSLLTVGRPLSYVQQPPPPPPPLPQALQRDQGPPPSGPSLLASLFNPSARNTQNPPPSNTQNPPPANTQNPPPPNPFIPNAPNPPPENSISQPPPDMSSRSFSPRRTPPLPVHIGGSYHRDSSLCAEHYIREINAREVPPVKIVKQSTQNVVYKKEIRIRYLQPPTPPPPAPIIIREKRIPPPPPESPLLIRERKPEARTPPPLTIRERPPTAPPPLEPYIIEKNIPPPPPQPRQIIVERLPTPPPKPRTVIFEKWLPYKKVKRPVLLQKAPPPEPVKQIRNVIIEYEPLKAYTVRRVIEEGVFRVDPHQYSLHSTHSRSDGGDVRVVERIEDLPPPSENLMRVIHDYSHSSSHLRSYDCESPRHITEHISPSVQNLLSGVQGASGADHLTNISRASSTPAYRTERVLSAGYGSSVPSPTVVPLQHSDSKVSHTQLGHYTQNDSPTRSQFDGVY